MKIAFLILFLIFSSMFKTIVSRQAWFILFSILEKLCWLLVMDTVFPAENGLKRSCYVKLVDAYESLNLVWKMTRIEESLVFKALIY